MGVCRDRDGESADLGMVRDVVGSFSKCKLYQSLSGLVSFSLVEVEEGKVTESLRYYQECFETPFLQETGHYYRLEAARKIAELSCSDYIKNVVGQLQAARRAGTRFLHQTSVTKVRHKYLLF